MVETLVAYLHLCFYVISSAYEAQHKVKIKRQMSLQFAFST